MDIREFNNISNDQLPNELLNLDILDGSPPCTTFSISGDRESSWGKVKKFREGQAEQTLDDLLFVFVETVGKLRPKVAIMENVEGLVVGNAITYLRQVYSKFEQIGYSVRCYLCKGEEMGIPQKRHRVFFIAVKDKFDFDELNMNFNYEPIPFGDVKSDIIDHRVSETTKHLLDNAIEDVDSSLADVNMRLYNKRSRFNEQIIWDDKVCNTLHNHGLYRGNDKCKLQLLDYIHCQTFPEDYNADGTNLVYLIGMSVPPIMIKRIVERLLDTNIFNK